VVDISIKSWSMYHSIDMSIFRSAERRDPVWKAQLTDSTCYAHSHLQNVCHQPHPNLRWSGVGLPYISTTPQWKHLNAIRTIGLRTITGTRTIYVKNHILLNQSGVKCLKDTIRPQSKSMFYRNARSRPKLGSQPVKNPSQAYELGPKLLINSLRISVTRKGTSLE